MAFLLPFLLPSHLTDPSPEAVATYEFIVKPCKQGDPIPSVSFQHAEELFKKLKKDVLKLHSTSPNHYLHAG